MSEMTEDLLSEPQSLCICMQVIDKQLEKHDWLANDQYSIADMANFCWVIFGATAGGPCIDGLGFRV